MQHILASWSIKSVEDARSVYRRLDTFRECYHVREIHKNGKSPIREMYRGRTWWSLLGYRLGILLERNEMPACYSHMSGLYS